MLMNSEEFNGYLSTSQNNCKSLCKRRIYDAFFVYLSVCVLQTNFILISFTKSCKYKLDKIIDYDTPETIF